MQNQDSSGRQPQEYPASEIYMPVSSQEYPSQVQSYISQYPPVTPAQEITNPQVQGQDIVIYPNRQQAILRTILCGICVLILIPLFAVSFSLLFLVKNTSQGINTAPLMVVIVAIAIVALLVLAFCGWITWSMAQLFLKPAPLLTINREGIAIGKAPMFSGFFIPWNEIEEIYSYTFMYKYLCIRPRNTGQFMKRFGLLERALRYSNMMVGIPPLVAPQVFLEKPVDEILQRLYAGYANELFYYRIRLRR